ncbi:MAG: DUF5668 domain-containing protein [Candidatus Saccharibacteria bacterium]|nr:DUF5668 domain-containing protein [Candidatus Saccharibacteria bacterium]
MKKNLLLRVFFGLMVVALGVILLLQNLGVINYDIWQQYGALFWGSALTVAGVLAMVANRHFWIIGLPLVIVGLGMILRSTGIVDINLWKLFWPVLLIAVGLAAVFRPKASRQQPVKKDVVAVFYGDESRVKGQYDGGSLTAIFGGVELDLRDAKITNNAVIEVLVFCGGVSVLVPENVVVENDVRGILGDSDDKTSASASAKTKLYIRGECILGGFEVKTKA